MVLTDPNWLLVHALELLDLRCPGWEFGRVPVTADAADLVTRLIAAATRMQLTEDEPPALPPGIREVMRSDRAMNVHDQTGAVIGAINVGAGDPPLLPEVGPDARVMICRSSPGSTGTAQLHTIPAARLPDCALTAASARFSATLDAMDVLVGIGSSGIPYPIPLAEWIACGPGPRHGRRPMVVHDRVSGEELPLSTVPLHLVGTFVTSARPPPRTSCSPPRCPCRASRLGVASARPRHFGSRSCGARSRSIRYRASTRARPGRRCPPGHRAVPAGGRLESGSDT